jgi:CDGSH-type Zn-finger protein
MANKVETVQGRKVTTHIDARRCAHSRNSVLARPVAGLHELLRGAGRTIGRATKTYLCRCGASAIRPYCDGSHKRLAFTAV